MPVHVTILSVDTSAMSRGARPFFMSSAIHLGLTPSSVTLYRATSRTSTPTSGLSGLPS